MAKGRDRPRYHRSEEKKMPFIGAGTKRKKGVPGPGLVDNRGGVLQPIFFEGRGGK